jgi:imidazoleglycerol-phosphate dehydratase
MARTGRVERTTKETTVAVEWALDGKGESEISTGIGFFDHMLQLLAKHGFFGLKVGAKGDIEVDHHHTVEDVGIVMGRALKASLGDFSGLTRYGWAVVPMDEALALVAIDVCGRPNFVWKGDVKGQIGTFDVEVVKEFFKGFVTEARLALHVNLMYGDNLHHQVEAVFKAFAKALRQAVTEDKAIEGALSTKGLL